MVCIYFKAKEISADLVLMDELQAKLATAALVDMTWDLSAVVRLDSAAAVLLWRAWKERWPAALVAPPGVGGVCAGVCGIDRDAGAPALAGADDSEIGRAHV